MGFRFRKSIGKGPFRMTFSKSGVSTSFGVKGARITKKSNGNTMSTIGIPGTGITYVTETSNKKETKKENKEKPQNNKQQKEKKPFYKKWWFWVLVGVGIIGCFGSGGEDTSSVAINETTTSIIEEIVSTTTIETIEFTTTELTTTVVTTETTSKITPTTNSTKQTIYFYVTEYGKKYHRASCRHIKNSNIIKITEDRARYNYEPCGTCNP